MPEEPGVTELVFSLQTGGSERIAAEISAHLRSRGRNVSVCATHGGEGPTSELLDRAGISWMAAGSGRGGRLQRLVRLYRHFRRTRCRVLHVHHFNMLAIGWLPARLAGVERIILTEHSDFKLRSDPSTMRRARWFGPRADAVSVVHEGLRSFVCDAVGVRRSVTRVIPNGVDTSVYVPRPGGRIDLPPLGCGPQPARVCTVGRLHPDKDHLNLLRALNCLKEEGIDDIGLYIIGEGSERSAIERFVASCGLHDSVALLGDRNDVRELLNEMDLFVLSSRTEGLPVALLEAMSTGLASVVTDVGGVADALADGGGIVVPPGDPVALAQGILRLVGNEDLRHRMGRDARATAVRRFDRGAMLGSYERLLFGEAPIGSASERGGDDR